MDFDNTRPIYLQLLEDFKLKISIGDWPSGGKIDPVRSLATDYGVNPNTVQKALAELEREGLAESRRTSGRFVTDDLARVKSLEGHAFRDLADNFIEGAESLNMKKDEAMKKLADYWEENDDSN